MIYLKRYNVDFIFQTIKDIINDPKDFIRGCKGFSSEALDVWSKSNHANHYISNTYIESWLNTVVHYIDPRIIVGFFVFEIN